MTEAATPRVGTGTLFRVALGTLVLQASYHPERRQGLGMAAALAPLHVLWTRAEERRRFLERNLAPMNTNPAMAGVLLGALARLEARAAAGEPSALERAATLRRTLEGPLAAAGDGLLWAGLRPAAALAGGIVAWWWGAAGVGVFLVSYNGLHLGLRLGGVFWGHARAETVHRILRARWLRAALRGLPWIVLAGGLALVCLAAAGCGPPGWSAAPAAVVGAVLGRRGVSRGGLLAAGAIVTGLILAVLSNR